MATLALLLNPPLNFFPLYQRGLGGISISPFTKWGHKGFFVVAKFTLLIPFVTTKISLPIP
jgi:hypothetical protein